MAQIIVTHNDSWESWRVKTNQIAQYLGDVSTLQDQNGNQLSSIVEAIQNMTNQNIAISIALG